MSQNLIKRWYHLTSPHFLVVLSRVRIKKSLLVSFVSGSMITKFDVAKSSSYPHYPVGRYYHGIPPDLWVRMNVSRFHLSQEAWIIWCRKIFLFTLFSCCTILSRDSSGALSKNKKPHQASSTIYILILPIFSRIFQINILTLFYFYLPL